MNCDYCGNALDVQVKACAGCGSPRTAPLAEPAGTAATIYEQIGRAVVHREPGREPNDALDRLLHIGERRNASTREQKITRAAKIVFCLLILWQFPMILLLIFSVGIMFFIWVYVPYMGLKRLMGWLSS